MGRLKNKTFLAALILLSVVAWSDTPPPPNNFLKGISATPSNPPSGDYKFYIKKSDGLAYMLNSSGAESFLTANAIKLQGRTVSSGSPSGGDVLTWNSSTSQWAPKAPATTSPGGSDTQIQFNSAGSFGGSSNLVWDGSHLLLNDAPAGGILSIRSNSQDQIWIQKTSGFQSYILGIDGSSNFTIRDYTNGRDPIKIASGAANEAIYIHDSSNTFIDINGNLDMKTHSISNVVDPSSAQQAATKNYVDTKTYGVSIGGTGSDLSATGGASQVLKQTSTGANITVGTLACSDLSNDAASCSTDTTNASNISSGTLGAARLPNPSSSTLGGIQSYAAVTNQWINTISTSGVPSSSQPAFSNISGTATSAQLPDPILLGNGSLTNSTYSFTNDPNSGMFLAAANNPAFAVDGAQAMNFKKSSGGFGNVGMGGDASTSDNYPLVMQRTVSGGGVFIATENISTGTNSKACLRLIAHNNTAQGELCMGAAGSVDILDKALRIRVEGDGKGIFYDAGGLSTGFHEFRVGGDPLSTGTSVKMNSNKSTTFYGAPIIQVQGAGTTPTCDTARLGGLALTSGLILCVCNGSGTTWKQVSDGTTTCTF